MGLPLAVPIPEDQQKRSYITVIPSNWHLLPKEQMLELLGWTLGGYPFPNLEVAAFIEAIKILLPMMRCWPLQKNVMAPLRKRRWNPGRTIVSLFRNMLLASDYIENLSAKESSSSSALSRAFTN